MRHIMITFNGEVIDAGHMVEKTRDAIKKMGVQLEDLTDEQAVLLAANVKGMSVPEFLGV